MAHAEVTVKGEPTKRFFVKMLVRDIELYEAILDLIDNCVDGIVRTNKNRRNINKHMQSN